MWWLPSKLCEAICISLGRTAGFHFFFWQGNGKKMGSHVASAGPSTGGWQWPPDPPASSSSMIPLQLVYAVLEINLRMLCMLGKHPTSRSTPPDQQNCPHPVLYFLLSSGCKAILGCGGAHWIAAQVPFAGGSSLFALELRKVSLCSGSKSLLIPVLQVSSLAHSSSWCFLYEVTW